MNDTEILDFIINENCGYIVDMFDNLIERKVDIFIDRLEKLEVIVDFMKSIYFRVYHQNGEGYVNIFILSKLYKYIFNKPNFDENFNILLKLYDGSKEEFIEECEYENL